VPNVTGLIEQLRYSPVAVTIVTDRHGEERMSVKFGSHGTSGKEFEAPFEHVGRIERSSSLEEIRKVEELPQHQNVTDDNGKQHEVSQEDELIEIPTADNQAPREIDGTHHVVAASDKKPLTPQEVAQLTPTVPQQAQHEAARSKEKYRLSMAVSCGVTSFACFGAMIYGLASDNARKAPLFAVGMGIATLLALFFFLYYLYGIIRSKGIIPHTESNLR
jgi:hypothetical protein